MSESNSLNLKVGDIVLVMEHEIPTYICKIEGVGEGKILLQDLSVFQAAT